MKALGFIETFGLLPAIEAADAMVKAAEVHLLDKSLATGGLVTITVTGDVAAVKAAVDAGVASVARIQGARVVSQHVIARPDSELDKILAKLPGQACCANDEQCCAKTAAVEEVAKPAVAKEEAPSAVKPTDSAPTKKPSTGKTGPKKKK